MGRPVWPIALGLWLCACHAILPLSSSNDGSTPGADRTAPDLERPSDLQPHDARLADTLLLDGGQSVEAVILPDVLTVPEAFVTPDAVIMPVDVLLPDAFVAPDTWISDLPIASPCSGQAQALVVAQWTGPMVPCSSIAGGRTQCTAESLCNTSAGWHLCSASQYQGRGGGQNGPPTAAWLKACIRDGSTPIAPLDAVCSACSADVDLMAPLSWDCTTGANPKSTTGAYIGVVASSKCSQLGVSQLATEAYWEYKKADANVSAAVCCYN